MRSVEEWHLAGLGYDDAMARDLERKRARHREYMRDRYRTDPDFRLAHLAKVKVTKQRMREQGREAMLSAKLSGCPCGESDPTVLDFHHRDPDDKHGDVGSWMRSGWSVARLKQEIAKCNVICANCHRRLHSDSEMA